MPVPLTVTATDGTVEKQQFPPALPDPVFHGVP